MEVEERPFSELLSDVIDNRGKTCPTAETGIPLIATNCIRNELLYPTYDKVRFVSQETYSNWFRGHPKPGDIIFVNKATPGRVCLVPDPVDFCIAQDMVAVRANPKQVYPNYLFAVLRSPAVQEKIGQMHVGTLIPHFKKGDFDKLLLPIPGRKAQEFIGDAYFALSAKIDVNRRLNATLEAMARALFQSWFVDFDPVRAKLDGRQPAGLDAATAALFPEHLEETALGHTPKGWEVRSLDKIAHYLNGLALQKYPPGDGPTLPVIKIAQLRKGDSVGADRCNAHLPPAYIVQDGDVLFSWSGSLEVELWCGGPGALNQHLFKVTSPEFPKWFYYLWTLYHLDEFRLIAADKATTMGHIQRGHLTVAKVLIPPRQLLDAMTCTMSALIDQIIANRIQSRTLATLRDALLPKLLSGEVNL